MDEAGCLIILIIAFAVGLVGYKAGPCLLENSCGQPAPASSAAAPP